MATSLDENHPSTDPAASPRDARARVYQPVDAESFKKSMRQLAAAVSVVTTGDGAGARAGFTATAVCSVSAQPPQLLVCVNGQSVSHRKIQEWRSFCVNVLSSEQIHIARRFAGTAAVGEKRFEQGEWSTLATGSPVLKGCLVNFDCVLAQEFQAGTHTLFIGSISAISVIAGLKPLAFVDGQYLSVSSVRRVSAAEWLDWS